MDSNTKKQGEKEQKKIKGGSLWHPNRKIEKGQKMTKCDSKCDKNVTGPQNVIQKKLESLKGKKILGKG